LQDNFTSSIFFCDNASKLGIQSRLLNLKMVNIHTFLRKCLFFLTQVLWKCIGSYCPNIFFFNFLFIFRSIEKCCFTGRQYIWGFSFLTCSKIY